MIWDDVTSSLFINSEDTYNWLVNTNEYQQAKKNKAYTQYIGSYTFTPSYGEPLMELNITEANSNYMIVMLIGCVVRDMNILWEKQLL